jgi:hypothetical protein
MRIYLEVREREVMRKFRKQDDKKLLSFLLSPHSVDCTYLRQKNGQDV